MSKMKNMIILLVIFIILLVVVISLNKKEKTEIQRTRMEATEKVFSDLDANQVYNIEIKTIQDVEPGTNLLDESDDFINRESLVFKLEDNLWWVARGAYGIGGDTESVGPSGEFYRADRTKVENMIELVAGVPYGQLVTSDTTKQADFGLTGPEAGLELILKDHGGQVLAHLLVGQKAGSPNNFIRQPDSDEIYEYNGSDLTMTFNTKLTDMRSRDVFEVTTAEIESFNIADHENGTSVDLTLADGTWSGVNQDEFGLDLDLAKVDDLLNKIDTMSVHDFVNRKKVPVPSIDLPDYNIGNYWPSEIPINSNLGNVRRGSFQPGAAAQGDTEGLVDDNAINITGDYSGTGSSIMSFYEGLDGWSRMDSFTREFTMPAPRGADPNASENVEVVAEVLILTDGTNQLKVKHIVRSTGDNIVTLTYMRQDGDYTGYDLWGFENPLADVTFTVTGGTEHHLKIGIKEGTKYYVVVDGNMDDIIQVSSTTIDWLRNAETNVIVTEETGEMEPVPIDTDGVSSEEVDIQELIDSGQLPPEILEQLGQ